MEQAAGRSETGKRASTRRFDIPPASEMTFGRVRLLTPRTRNPPNLVVTMIGVILACGSLYFASGLFVPIVISILAYLTLRPIASRLCSLGLPPALASGLLIVSLFAVLGVIISLLYSPTQTWLATAPNSIERIKHNFASIAEPLTILERAEDRLDEATDVTPTGEPVVEVSIKKPKMVNQTVLISTTGQIFAFVAAIAVLTFFMLSTGDDLLNRVLRLLPDQESRHQLLEKISGIQQSVGKYLAQITFINIGLGLAVSVVMWVIGMPTPILWGVLATLFNFIPYIGPLAATALVFLAAASSFDTVSRAGFTAVAFWSITAVEGQFVTPSILGKTLKVGPVVVLVAVAFWGFLWGLPGVFLAVPLLIVARQIFASFDRTLPIAVILGEETCEPREGCEPIHEDQLIAEIA